ncbi:MAG: putative molybdenum carrier protein [Verrucomicrobia bacterium]|nr:putative molybdenum carrier protein [Verrucomicrobiota bacterium]
MRLVCAEQMKIIRVISGGQTGADRAALDAAVVCGVDHGGWCPKGRFAEDGPIPAKYNLQETEDEDYPSRTKANVEAADLTLIFSRGPLRGGSLLTQKFAQELGKPCVHIDLLEYSDIFQALEKLPEFFPNVGKIVLNVAGPRASNDPEIYTAVYEAMISLLHREAD